MLKIAIEVKGNKFALETEAPLGEVSKYLDFFFDAISCVDQQKLDQLAARGAAANQALKTAIENTSPGS